MTGDKVLIFPRTGIDRSIVLTKHRAEQWLAARRHILEKVYPDFDKMYPGQWIILGEKDSPMANLFIEDILCWAYTIGRIEEESGDLIDNDADLLSDIQNEAGLLTRIRCEPLHRSMDLTTRSWAWSTFRVARLGTHPQTTAPQDLWGRGSWWISDANVPAPPLGTEETWLPPLCETIEKAATEGFTLWSESPRPTSSPAFAALSAHIAPGYELYLVSRQGFFLPHQFRRFNVQDFNAATAGRRRRLQQVLLARNAGRTQ